MKVVHLSTSDRGGAGIAASRLHLSLLENGVDSWFLTLHKFTDDLPQHVKYLPGDGTLFPFLKNGVRKFKRVLRRYRLLSSKEEILRKEHLSGRKHGFEHFSFPFSDLKLQDHPLIKGADIIHLHWVSDGFLDYKNFFTGLNKNVVWTLHDMNPFTGGCHHSDGCLLFRNNCEPCFQLEGTKDLNFAGKMLVEKMQSLSDKKQSSVQIITPSKWLCDLSSTSALFGNFLHQVIPNAFNPDQFKQITRKEAREKLNVADNCKVIFVNAHHIDNHRKGLSYLLDALERLPKHDYLLMVAGHTMRPDLFPNLHHLGYLKTAEDLSLAYSAADVFVLSSLAENLPNTICESLMCGTPVVAFDTGGIKELLNDTNGILVPMKDSDFLSKAVEIAASKKWDRDLIRTDAINRFGHLKVGKDHIELYKNLLESK